MSSKGLYAGIDVGSSRIKVVLMDETKNLVGYSVNKSGYDFLEVANGCLDEALNVAGFSFPATWTRMNTLSM